MAKKANTSTQAKGLVPSLVHAVAVLDLISTSREPAGVTSIARQLGISPSSCFNILKTLAAYDFVEIDPVSKAYTLGTGALALARRVIGENGMLEFALPQLHKIAEDFTVTACLWRLTRKGRWVLLGFAESSAPARVHFSLGQRLPGLGGALGRCVAAHSDIDAKDLADQIRDVQWNTQPDIRAYRAELKEVLKRRWAFDEGGFIAGISSLASPVLDADGEVRYACSATMFAGQISGATLERLGEATSAVAERAASRIFGHVMRV